MYKSEEKELQHGNEEKLKKSKIIAPIIITILLVIILGIYFVVYMLLPWAIGIKLVIGAVIFTLVGVCIFVLIERIKEIRSGEEDDLSNY